MPKWVENIGKNEEAAIEAALQKPGMDRDEVSAEILERAKSGFLGIGGCPVKARTSYEALGEPEEHFALAEAIPAEAEPVKTAEHTVRGETLPSPAAPVAEGEKVERIGASFAGLLTQTGTEARSVTRTGENGIYQVELVGRELGGPIGRRDETPDAIQQLTGYVVNHGQSRRVRIHTNIEGYRVKQEESLTRLAWKVAGRVVKYRRSVTLESMNAHERHVIHTTLQETPDITTYSIGTESNRRTMVMYSRGEHRWLRESGALRGQL